MMKKPIGREKGIALIMVLWVITILMAIALSFSFSTRTTTGSTLAFKDHMADRFIAEAGIERGIMEIFYRRLNQERPSVEGEEGVWRVDGSPNIRPVGSGRAAIRIVDETGKVDINKAPDVILKNLFLNLGLGEEEVNIIVDSIQDWKDEDDLHRISGAESDYYMSLPKPYHAKNGPFDTLEELLLVKGMSADILYGTAEKKGVLELFTVYSGADKINPNTASKEVLMALPGMSADIADSIIAARQEKELRSAQDLALLLGRNYLTFTQYFNVSEGSVYTVESVGQKSGRGRFAAKAVVTVDGNKYKYLYFRSPAVETVTREAAPK